MNNCIHLIDDVRPGGVLTNLNTLIGAASNQQTCHTIRQIDARRAHLARHFNAQTIVVHFSISWAKLPYLCALRLLNRNARLLLQEHHYSAEHFSQSPAAITRFKALYRMTAPLFDQVIAVSQRQAAWYQSMNGRDVTVIPPMTGLAALLELPQKLPAQRLVVGISGRLTQDKGIDLALQLLELPQAQPFDFLFAGYGDMESAVARAAAKFPNVRFMGHYKNPQEFLLQCDLVMIPSRLDTYGLSALEARAAGKPIIVTRICGLTDQARDCGIVSKPGCPNALAAALEALNANNQLSALGHKARSGARLHNQNAMHRWASELSGT